MPKKELIKLIIKGFQDQPRPEIIKREVELPTGLNKVISVIGARRCGKTFLLYDTINVLIKNGLDIHDILFINFEDERLQLKIDELDLIVQAWRELHDGQNTEKHWFFFDEIQNASGWEKFIRRLYDTVTKNIFITGSNSAFLAKEIATSLRGRTLQFELFPYSFKEYLTHLKIDPDYYSGQNRAKILNRFNAYLSQGGFPETVGLPLNYQGEILRNYFYVMLYKDLIERYQISSVSVLKYFIEKIADNLTKPFSLNKIYNDLRSQGLKLDKNLLYDLIIYIENIYLSFKIQRFDYSYASRNKSDKKAYFIDNGLANILSQNILGNIGKLLENSVFIFIKKNFGDLFNDSIYYFKDKVECDFVVCKQEKPMFCMQVCYDISSQETRKREIKGLLGALDFFNHQKGYIVTLEQEEKLNIDNKEILIIPAYKMMLNKLELM